MGGKGEGRRKEEAEILDQLGVDGAFKLDAHGCRRKSLKT